MSAIYLSGRYPRRAELKAVAERLIEAGHRVVSEWVFLDRDGQDSVAVGGQQRVWASEDTQDIEKCDVFVAFSEPMVSMISGATHDIVPRGASRGARHVEFGIALFLDKRMFVVGPRENVFHHLSVVQRLDSVDELKRILEG